MYHFQFVSQIETSPATYVYKFYHNDKLFTGKTVGEIASKLKSGELKGAPPGISDKPLVDTEQMKGEVIGEARQI